MSKQKALSGAFFIFLKNDIIHSMQVIPTINSKSFKKIKEKIELIETQTDSSWVQIDVADGTFTKNTIWHNASNLLTLETKLNIEVHLMISDIEKRIEDWLIEPVKRIIFHLETAKDPHFVIQKCKKANKEVGIAIGPDTSWTQLMPFCDKVNLFQILSVRPGSAGQKFQEESLEKIMSLRSNCPSAIIEVDGGVDDGVAKKVEEAGADIVAVASYIFNAKDVGKAIEELEAI
ncbi:hypothetical protein KJ751_02975 [Patescibacteria group bacterium]|nr:hypothetical protein [Patescibacteria group bacterium]